MCSSENEIAIRDLSRYYTSYMVYQDAEGSLSTSDSTAHGLTTGELVVLPVTRMLAQTLSNMVTANEALITSIWGSYMQLPEEQLILMYVYATLSPRKSRS